MVTSPFLPTNSDSRPQVTEQPVVEVNTIVAADTTDPEKVKAALPQIKAVMATNIRNPWICKNCGAIMGSVYHEKIRQGLSVSRLILFRGAVKIDETLPENFVFGKVDAGEFGCSRCGEVRHWHPSPESLRYLSEGNHHVRKKNRNV